MDLLKKKLVLGALCAVVAGCEGSNLPPNSEFVCYEDDKLVERHVGVTKAVMWEYGHWAITYADGQRVRYMQRMGESCAVESF